MSSFSRKILFPFLLLGFLLDINFYKNEVLADTEVKAANADDIALYEGMSASYVCLASRKGVDLDFDKSLNVAVTTFVNVIQGKHGGKVIDVVSKKKKEVKVEPKILGFNGTIKILARALQICPDTIPEKTKQEFDKIVKQIQKENLKKD